MESRIVEIRQSVLDKNDRLARAQREQFRVAGVTVVNLMSGPGSGKTALLEESLGRLRSRTYRPAALVGDLATENDANRLARSGVPVRQIVTGSVCHLEAEMIGAALAGWSLAELDFLFIENVGNLVCPAGYDLGEAVRVALLAVTEGEDKPQKYPPMFNAADVVVITKVDLVAAIEFDRQAALKSVAAVAPGVPVFETSARSGEGVDAWLDYLIARREAILGRVR